LSELDEKSIPADAEQILFLDLTENNFTGAGDLRFLFDFPNLKTLILDKNQIQSNIKLPFMNNLTTLWVNHNKIENLAIFIQNLATSCPNLSYLSMMNNKAAPSYFNGGSLVEYNDYRLYVISKLAKLQMLDDNQISTEERNQSQAIYGTGRLARYNDYNTQNSKRKSIVSKKNRTLENQPNPEETKTKLEQNVSSNLIESIEEKKIPLDATSKEQTKKSRKSISNAIREELVADKATTTNNTDIKKEKTNIKKSKLISQSSNDLKEENIMKQTEKIANNLELRNAENLEELLPNFQNIADKLVDSLRLPPPSPPQQLLSSSESESQSIISLNVEKNLPDIDQDQAFEDESEKNISISSAHPPPPPSPSLSMLLETLPENR
jgi:hypothetical protein